MPFPTYYNRNYNDATDYNSESGTTTTKQYTTVNCA